MSGNRTDDPLYQNVMGEDPNEIPDTPAYQVLKKANLLCTKYRLQSAQEIEALPHNSNMRILKSSRRYKDVLKPLGSMGCQFGGLAGWLYGSV